MFLAGISSRKKQHIVQTSRQQEGTLRKTQMQLLPEQVPP